ncbi:4199_t:CDS:2 [Scutellospora calospora]|uniref:4199_t:CDS:1 n=1 Tax=Scutellospora calospora TaxID=85575 RepID=A0ACA9MNL4_9GLOM|nr:4199_t:CDS:2 [Scutellospora calospora]
MLKIQEDQIKQAFNYHAIKIVKNEVQRYFAIDLDDSTLFSENPNFTDITAKSMLNLVNEDKVVEI